MNKFQRIGLGAAIFLTVALVLVHFPFEGYQTKEMLGGYRAMPCPWDKSDDSCGVQFPLSQRELPWIQWTSIGALFMWPSALKDFLIGFVLIWCGYIALYWVTKRPSPLIKES